MAVSKVLASGDSLVGGVMVNGIKVVGEQVAVIANTTSAVNSNNVADMPTTVNAILVALKAHGLIASA